MMINFVQAKNFMFWVAVATVIPFLFFTGFAARAAGETIESLPEPYISISPDYFYTLEEILYVEGRADPKALVTVTLRADNERPVKFTVKPDSTGEWVIAEKTYLPSGNWEVRARQQIGGVISDWSNPRVVKSVVTGVSLFGFRIRYVVIAAVVLVFFLILGCVLIYFRKKIKKLQRGLVEKQIQATEERLHRSLAEVRKELMDQLRDLTQNAENRPLTSAELEKRDRVLSELENLEHDLHHDIDDIEKRI